MSELERKIEETQTKISRLNRDISGALGTLHRLMCTKDTLTLKMYKLKSQREWMPGCNRPYPTST